MTVTQIGHATGISRAKIYKDLESGELCGFHLWLSPMWHADANEVVRWAEDRWAEGRCTMYPPDHVRKFIADFKLT